MKIENINIDELISNIDNPREHPEEQINQIANSIKEFGFNNPVLIDKNNIIIAGHGRIKAAKKLNISKIPSIRIEHLTERQKRAFMVADNKISMNAEWNKNILTGILNDLEISDFDINLTGFSDYDLDMLVNETEINFNPETNPGFMDNEITEEDLEKKENELDNRYKKDTSYRTIICPYCGKELTINE